MRTKTYNENSGKQSRTPGPTEKRNLFGPIRSMPVDQINNSMAVQRQTSFSRACAEAKQSRNLAFEGSLTPEGVRNDR